jgi:hypothetical protein
VSDTDFSVEENALYRDPCVEIRCLTPIFFRPCDVLVAAFEAGWK